MLTMTAWSRSSGRSSSGPDIQPLDWPLEFRVRTGTSRQAYLPFRHPAVVALFVEYATLEPIDSDAGIPAYSASWVARLEPE